MPVDIWSAASALFAVKNGSNGRTYACSRPECRMVSGITAPSSTTDSVRCSLSPQCHGFQLTGTSHTLSNQPVYDRMIGVRVRTDQLVDM